MKAEVWTEEIHSMDHQGSLHFEVEQEGHELGYSQWWENCGLTGESFRCSCGLASVEHPGNGCWQWGHNVPSDHVPFDLIHAEMVLAALEEAQTQDVGCPAEWRGLAMLAIANLGKGKKSGVMRLLKKAQKIAKGDG